VLASGWKVAHHLEYLWDSTGMPISWTLSIWEAQDGAGRRALIQTDEVEGSQRIACCRGDVRQHLMAALLGEHVSTNGACYGPGIMGGFPTSLTLYSDAMGSDDLERALWVFIMEETREHPGHWADIEEQLHSAFESPLSMAECLEKAIARLKPTGLARCPATDDEGADLPRRRALLKVWFEEVSR
jgi:hypothetical protein